MEARDKDVIVIGGGVIGLACAHALLGAGRSVLVLEREAVGAGASSGNCGLITPSHAEPIARPGMVGQVLRWMLRSDSPVYVRPRLDLDLLAWSLRFARSCGRRRMGTALRGRAALLGRSRELLGELVERDGLRCEWDTGGLLQLFATEEARAAATPAHRLLDEIGVPWRELSRDELLEREPAVRDELVGGCWFPTDAKLRPEALLTELARLVTAAGGRIEEGREVRGFAEEGGRVRGVVTDDGERRGGRVLLAAGAWAPALGRALGLRLPIQPGRGYSVTAPRPDPCPRYALVLEEANMAAVPWSGGLRLGGTMELSGYDAPPRPERYEALWTGARRYLRALPAREGAAEWTGWRPMTPDELPVIDVSPRHPEVLLAVGHGMMGVSMCTATAELVTALVCGDEPAVDPAPYAASRYGL